MHSKGAKYIETLNGKRKKNDAIQFVGNIDGKYIFYANDYILVDKSNNEYYSGYFSYGKNGRLIKEFSGTICYDKKDYRLLAFSRFNNDRQDGDLELKRIKRENGKLTNKSTEINVKSKCFVVKTNRNFNNRKYKQEIINKDTDINSLKIDKKYNKFLMVFHGYYNGKLEDESVNFKDIVNKLSAKVKKNGRNNGITKIKLVSCFGAMNDMNGNNLLDCISKSFDKPVVVSVANSEYATANITLQDKNGKSKQYTYPVDYSPNSGTLISKYLSGTLNEQERIDYKNKYFNHFYIDKGQIYQIDYSFYNMIKYMSKDDIEANLQFGLADKHENVKKVLPDLKGKYGFKVINHSIPTLNTNSKSNNINYNF